MASISFASGVENEGVEQDELPQIRAQGEHPPRLRQVVNIRDSADRLMGYKVLEDAGPQGEPVCYTPNGDTAIGGVWDELGFVQVYSGGSYRKIKYTWELPVTESDKPTLLFFNYNGFSYSEWTGAFFDEYIVVDGPTVELVLELSNSEWTANINGQQLPESATSAISARIPSPVFKSRRNGLHTVRTEVSGDGPISISGSTDLQSKEYSYYQRGLVFLDEFPEYDPNYTPESEPPEPITIENRVAWSDGAELNDEDVTWSIGGGNGGKSGIGKNISVLWDPIDRIFTRAAVGDEKKDVENFEEVPLELIVRTDIFEGPDWFFPITYKLEHEFGVPGAAELRIVKERVEPGAFTDGNDQAELTAEAVLIGLSPGDYKIEWTVDVIDSSGDPVRNNLVSDGEGWEISAQWDGRDDSGEPVDDPQSHIFVIKVKACPDEDIAVANRSLGAVRKQDVEKCIETELEVPILPPEDGILEIYDGAGEELLATSEPEPFTGGSDLIASLSAMASLSLSESNDNVILKRRGQNSQIQIRYIVSKADAGTRTSIPLEIRTTYSNKTPFTVEVPKVGESQTKVQFRKTFTLTDGTTSGSNIGIRSPENSFTTFDQSSGKKRSTPNPMAESEYLDGNAQDGDRWRKGEIGTELGYAAALTESETSSNKYRPNKTPPTEIALMAAGFEDLIVTRPGNATAWTRVKNQARRIYISGHGAIQGDFYAISSTDGFRFFVSPSVIDNHWKDNLELLIVAGCSVFNIGNFNGWEAYNVSPGRSWKAATKPGSVLLGYNATAPAAALFEKGPSDYADTRILDRYRLQLPIQSGKYPDPGEAKAMAWLVANASMEVRLADNACAVSDEYYYFIRTIPKTSDGEKITDPHNQNDLGVYSQTRDIWRVHRDFWGQMGSRSFDDDIPKRQRGKTRMRDLPGAGAGEAEKI